MTTIHNPGNDREIRTLQDTLIIVGNLDKLLIDWINSRDEGPKKVEKVIDKLRKDLGDAHAALMRLTR